MFRTRRRRAVEIRLLRRSRSDWLARNYVKLRSTPAIASEHKRKRPNVILRCKRDGRETGAVGKGRELRWGGTGWDRAASWLCRETVHAGRHCIAFGLKTLPTTRRSLAAIVKPIILDY